MKPLLHRALEPEIQAAALRRASMSWIVFALGLIVAIGAIVGFWYTTVPHLIR